MAETIYEILDRIDAQPDELALPPNASSLDFLRAVYRDPRLQLSVRMRAAVAALGFEHPRLTVTANLNTGLGSRTEAMMTRQGIATVIDAKPR
jgi:hypothetical protein